MRNGIVAAWATAVMALAGAAGAQTPTPPAAAESLKFQDAIQRAIEKNPSAAIAAAGILHAQAILSETRGGTRLQVNASVNTTTLNTGVEFGGQVVSPRNSVVAALDVRMPLFAASQWARRAQAEDQQHVAELSAAETRRQIALATADAYLSVIARRRVVEADARARDTAKAHFDLASQLEQGGSGSRLNTLRAQQELSTDDGLVESARLALYRAQEALGVLLVADGPVDAAEDPAFDLPADTPPATDDGLLQFRTDLKLFSAETQAATRVVHDSSRDYWPSLEAVFQPQTTYPTSLFLPQNRWQFLLQTSIPLWDSGQRKAQKADRQSSLDITAANLASALTQAKSDVRTARAAVASAERGLSSAKAAADEAHQVVDITNISFRAGAATNIEVIDAERAARDADTSVAVSEDTLRRARLDLLTALGRFPG